MTSIIDAGNRWLPNVTDDDYHTIEALRASHLKQFMRSPAHYLASLMEPKKDSGVLNFGKAVHLACLQPDLFQEQVAVPPKCDKRTKEGKALYEKFLAETKPDALLLNEEEFKHCVGMSESFHRYSKEVIYAEEVLCPYFERAGVGIIDDIPVPVKIKPDVLLVTKQSKIKLIDLKTCEDASEEAFTRAIFNYGYHWQAALYALVTEAIENLEIQTFQFVAIEKTPPYAYRVYNISPETMLYAKNFVRSKLRYFKVCEILQDWPGYDSTPFEVRMPDYKRKEIY